MHEYSIVSSMLDQVSREIQSRADARVRRISVRIGDASGVEAELFQSAFEQLRGGACDEAELWVERVPACWRCLGCQRQFARDEALLCTICGSPGTLVSGAELMLDRIELEVSHV